MLLIAGGAVAASVAIPLHLAARREQAAVSRLRAVGAGRGDVAAVVSELVGEGGLVGYRVVRLAGPGLALGAVPSNPADNRALLLLPDGRLVAREVDSAPFAAGDPPPEVPGDGWVPVPVEPAD